MWSEILNTLDKNSEIIMITLTAIYVIATISYVWIATRTTREMRRSNELLQQSQVLARESIKQNIEFERLRNRPYVIFEFISENRLFFATIKNIGNHAAYDVKISS